MMIEQQLISEYGGSAQVSISFGSDFAAAPNLPESLSSDRQWTIYWHKGTSYCSRKKPPLGNLQTKVVEIKGNLHLQIMWFLCWFDGFFLNLNKLWWASLGNKH